MTTQLATIMLHCSSLRNQAFSVLYQACIECCIYAGKDGRFYVKLNKPLHRNCTFTEVCLLQCQNLWLVFDHSISPPAISNQL